MEVSAEWMRVTSASRSGSLMTSHLKPRSSVRERDLVGVGLVEVEELLDVVVGRERALAAAGLKAEPRLAGAHQVELALEGQRRRREREEVVEIGRDLLGSPKHRVAKTH